MNKISLISILTFVSISPGFAQVKGRAPYDETGTIYDWTNFDATNFLVSTVICGVLIGSAFKLKDYNKRITKILGNILLIVGAIYALMTIAMPILGILEILWQVLFGIAILIGIIYYIVQLGQN